MPTATGPALVTVITGGLSGTLTLPDAADAITPGPGFALRVGITMRDAGLDLELITGSQRGTTASGFDFTASPTRADILWRVYDGYRAEPYVGGGVGWRHLRFSEVTVDGESAGQALGYEGLPVMEPAFGASTGLRYWVSGPFHARADAHLGIILSEQGTGEVHALVAPGVSLGLDLRWEPPPDRDRDGVPDKTDRCPDSL